MSVMARRVTFGSVGRIRRMTLRILVVVIDLEEQLLAIDFETRQSRALRADRSRGKSRRTVANDCRHCRQEPG